MVTVLNGLMAAAAEATLPAVGSSSMREAPLLIVVPFKMDRYVIASVSRRHQFATCIADNGGFCRAWQPFNCLSIDYTASYSAIL